MSLRGVKSGKFASSQLVLLCCLTRRILGSTATSFAAVICIFLSQPQIPTAVVIYSTMPV
jgi:hypothetical protein